ncbi:MAG: methylcobamide--CoM methyltransferase [Clostridiales Family XIII bacterium]|jgi:[methyl-Co(III) methanol-specific corrinoid protein]:coenzyme M methyltransferase|nr:methylcobamide--CoM methyltransferase [Clostridiales Family XIII bacterium]
MNDLSPKERLIRTLNKETTDRRPVICPGGMMNATVVEVQELSSRFLPAAHTDADGMKELAGEVQQRTGFENFGVPYDMTIEPEVLGSEIDLGTIACEPKIVREVFASAAETTRRDIKTMLGDGRVGVLADAIAKLHALDPDIPVIGSLTGPVSTAASIIDPMPFLKGLRKDAANSHSVMGYVTDFLIAYADLLIDHGADVINIADPTATGEILGPKAFGEFAVPYINRIADAVHGRGVKVILHICGEMKAVWKYMPEIRADAISTDAMVSLKNLKADFPQIVTMGNLSTYMLESAEPGKIEKRTEKLLADGIDILAPACGLSTASPIQNLRAFTDTVRKIGDSGTGK